MSVAYEGEKTFKKHQISPNLRQTWFPQKAFSGSPMDVCDPFQIAAKNGIYMGEDGPIQHAFAK